MELLAADRFLLPATVWHRQPHEISGRRLTGFFLAKIKFRP